MRSITDWRQAAAKAIPKEGYFELAAAAGTVLSIRALCLLPTLSLPIIAKSTRAAKRPSARTEAIESDRRESATCSRAAAAALLAVGNCSTSFRGLHFSVPGPFRHRFRQVHRGMRWRCSALTGITTVFHQPRGIPVELESILTPS